MGDFDQGLEGIASLCVGAASVAFGGPPTGTTEGTIGLAKIINSVRGRRDEFGPERARVLGRIRAKLHKVHKRELTKRGGNWAAGADLEAADHALQKTLQACFLDRRRLAEAAVSPSGFADGAVGVLMDALGDARPDLFGTGKENMLPYRYAQDVVSSGIAAAFEKADYYRRALGPKLAFEMARAVGQIRETSKTTAQGVGTLLVNTSEIAEEQKRHTNLLEDIARRVSEVPSQVPAVPMMAPKPPEDFVARPHEFDSLKRQLLDAKGDAVAITAALRGAGGYGKTTLAKALAHDPDVQDAYFDGVLWVELGEQGGDRVPTFLAILVALLTGRAPETFTIDGLRTALAKALGDRRILLVVDDVWRRQHLAPFLHGGPRTTRLVTTRFDPVLPSATPRQAVDAMQGTEALELIGWGVPASALSKQAENLGKMTARLGAWAQLLKLANGFLRRRLEGGLTLSQAVADLDRRLDTRGLSALNAATDLPYAEQHAPVAKVIDTSLDLLDGEKRDRFVELGVFPEDVDVPIGIVALLWAETGRIDDLATEDLVVELSGLSLLQSLDPGRGTLRLHDTTRHVLQHCAGEEGLVAQNRALVRAVAGIRESGNLSAPEAKYVYRYLPQHLADAGDREALDGLLLDPGWLKSKLAAIGSPPSLVADYDRHGHGRMQELIGRTLRLASGIYTRDPRQLLPQLMCRLMTVNHPLTSEFLVSARRLVDRPALLTFLPSLKPPGAEAVRLDGHTSGIIALTALPDGRLASGSFDNTIRLWDPRTGAELARLEGHTGGVTTLTVLPDGRVASAGYDNSIKLWDPGTWAELARLEGHTGGVTALAVLPDGRLASGDEDRTVRLWDLATGTETARLEGHTRGVDALVVLPDGRLASCGDNTVRLWDPVTGTEVARLEGPMISGLAVLSDGRLASCGWDSVVRLWDPIAGTELARLEGHTRGVTALAVLPDGRLASGGWDYTVRLWDPPARTFSARLESHTGSVSALTVLPGGCLASGGSDHTVRVWEPTEGTELARMEGHTSTVTALAVLPDSRLASSGWDGTVRVWDSAAGRELARLDSHARGVTALVVLPDGRLALGTHEGNIQLWDPATGAGLAQLRGHRSTVTALAVLPDNRLASGGTDGTVRLWGLATGTELARLEGHTWEVMALAMLPDGRLASGGADGTLRLWDPLARKGLACLEVDAREVVYRGVSTLAVLPDGRLASGALDRTVRLWDRTVEAELARLEVDAPVNCLAVLHAVEDMALRLAAGDATGHVHWVSIQD